MEPRSRPIEVVRRHNKPVEDAAQTELEATQASYCAIDESTPVVEEGALDGHYLRRVGLVSHVGLSDCFVLDHVCEAFDKNLL